MQALTFIWATLGAQVYDRAQAYDSAQSEVGLYTCTFVSALCCILGCWILVIFFEDLRVPYLVLKMWSSIHKMQSSVLDLCYS